LTDAGLKLFLDDYNKLQEEINKLKVVKSDTALPNLTKPAPKSNRRGGKKS
jgi:hypothetical protein